MIEVVPGIDVLRLLSTVATSPQRFSELTLCSPFIDEEISDRLRNVVEKAVRAGCAVRIITRPTTADRVADACRQVRRVVRIVCRDDLHAKAYVVHARPGQGTSEAIVTSANLTDAGLGRNLEIGVRIRTSSRDGRRLFEQVRRSLRDLSTHLN